MQCLDLMLYHISLLDGSMNECRGSVLVRTIVGCRLMHQLFSCNVWWCGSVSVRHRNRMIRINIIIIIIMYRGAYQLCRRHNRLTMILQL